MFLSHNNGYMATTVTHSARTLRLASCRNFGSVLFAINGRRMKLNSVEEAFSYRTYKTITTCYKMYKADFCYKQALSFSPSLSSAPGSRLPRRILRASLWSSRSPASAICQTLSTSTSSTRHLWDTCFFCSRTNSLEFTARLSEGSSCRLRTI